MLGNMANMLANGLYISLMQIHNERQARNEILAQEAFEYEEQGRRIFAKQREEYVRQQLAAYRAEEAAKRNGNSKF